MKWWELTKKNGGSSRKLSGSLYIQPQCCFYYVIINAQTSLLYSRKDGSMVKGYQGLAWTSGMEII